MSIYQGEIELSIPGKSAYEHALDGGYTGTEEEFNAILAGIENARGGGVNPNLLDNWYFANPVNQRGQTEYTGAGYSIDRWKSQNARLTVTVRDGYVNLAVSSTGRGYWRQPFENAFPIQDYTVSALVRGTGEGSFYLSDSAEKTVVTAIPFVVNSENWIMISATYSADSFTGNPYMVSMYGEANANLDVLAVKWELGSTQTLAHQDASGNWVLNEIPNYGEQLRKCQRYQYKLPIYAIVGVAHAYSETQAYWRPFFAVEMRSKFADQNAVSGLKVMNSAFAANGTAVTAITSGVITVVGGLTAGESYLVHNEAGNIVLDANL